MQHIFFLTIQYYFFKKTNIAQYLFNICLFFSFPWGIGNQLDKLRKQLWVVGSNPCPTKKLEGRKMKTIIAPKWGISHHFHHNSGSKNGNNICKTLNDWICQISEIYQKTGSLLFNLLKFSFLFFCLLFFITFWRYWTSTKCLFFLH